jgi:tetratricopeptide (TPR) repeat protein
MCLHQAEQQCASLEFKLQKVCSFLPLTMFRSQCSLMLQWMREGHPVTRIPPAPEPAPLPEAAPPPEPVPAPEAAPSVADRIAAIVAELANLFRKKADLAGPAGHSSSVDVPNRSDTDRLDSVNGGPAKRVSDLVRDLAKSSSIILADRARDLGCWEVAAKYYRDALQRDQDDQQIWVQYARVLKEAGRLPEAEVAYRTALGYDQGDVGIHLQLGHVLKAQAKGTEAEMAYLRAFALDSSQSDAMTELGQFGWAETDLAELRTTLGAEVARLRA